MKKVETFFRVSKEGNDLQWEMFDCTKMKLFSWLLLVVGCVFLCRKMRCMPIKRCGADFPQWNLYRTILQVTLNTNSLNHSPMRIAWAQTLLSFFRSFFLSLPTSKCFSYNKSRALPQQRYSQSAPIHGNRFNHLLRKTKHARNMISYQQSTRLDFTRLNCKSRWDLWNHRMSSCNRFRVKFG